MYRTVADAALIEAAQRITLLVRACRDEGERERRDPLCRLDQRRIRDRPVHYPPTSSSSSTALR